ncbi:DUF6990 domain-containing protein [Phyllobacterium endophyticum]|uniref:DUF6990 domain-containing protein n=1 Tax=Phyllobacterium endophyticum TaxID=1149773 RepID=UPI0011CB63CC|nr:hypothetical protein [Phyllobacterium endophyticum]TXR46288.1 hypothetical protein FVA77_25850 [Phyllobacterium endophyticum]
MLQNDIVLAFKKLSWQTGKDDAGDNYAIFDIGDIQLQIIPRLRPIWGGKRLACVRSVTTKQFTSACTKIFHRNTEKHPHNPLVRGDEDLIQQDYTFKDISALSERLIEWAKIQDVDPALKRLRELPTDSKGTEPLYHLAALALAGDVDKLAYYQRSFEAGDRLGFVPYISKEMIDRAVEIAKDTSSRISTE